MSKAKSREEAPPDSSMSSEPTELERRLIDRIKREGRITFRDFHHIALYDSDLGYYNTERLKIGPTGDYYTSSNVHKAFGAVLARAFVSLWAEICSVDYDKSDLQKTLTLTEMGAGTGQLALDILTSLRDTERDLFDHLNYLIIETSPAMLRLQRKKLAEFAKRVKWMTIEELEQSPVRGILFSNELIDAMPVHRIRFSQERIEECYVAVDKSGRLALEWAETSTSKLIDYINRQNVAFKEGWMIEINLDAIDWLADVSRAIESGYLITIDYGDVAGHLYAPDRKGGTLRSFHNHRLIDSPLERVGEQDLTSSVNFSALIDYGNKLGFETVSYERQTAFLFRNGLTEIIAAINPEADSTDNLKENLALKNLFVPGGVSDNFRVLVQRKYQTVF